jgi:hypothetical protein
MKGTSRRRILLACVLLLGLGIACGGGPAASSASSPSPSPSPTPTPVAAGSILGTWHVVVGTTKATGSYPNKAGDTAERSFTFSACASAGCGATLTTVVPAGPLTLDFNFDGTAYTAPRIYSQACPDPRGGTWNLRGRYSLAVTTASTEGGVFQATTFSGTYIEDTVPDFPASIHGCGPGHIEQTVDGTRTG